ncbi:MAG: SH3 beta-barrel fold-containing protein [Bacteroidales bacterium]|nr:SH3 beta-barrel fold-containing protein [Bacteroidales bacterium]
MTTSNILAASNTDLVRISFMIAKTNGNINPIMLGAKAAMIAELKKRFAKGEIVEFEYIKKSTGELRHATGCLPNNAFIASQINGQGVHNSIYGNCTYWDIERHTFRAFSYETLVRIF